MDKGLQGVKRGYRGLQAVTGVGGRKNKHEFKVENPTRSRPLLGDLVLFWH